MICDSWTLCLGSHSTLKSGQEGHCRSPGTSRMGAVMIHGSLACVTRGCSTAIEWNARGETHGICFLDSGLTELARDLLPHRVSGPRQKHVFVLDRRRVKVFRVHLITKRTRTLSRQCGVESDSRTLLPTRRSLEREESCQVARRTMLVADRLAETDSHHSAEDRPQKAIFHQSDLSEQSLHTRRSGREIDGYH